MAQARVCYEPEPPILVRTDCAANTEDEGLAGFSGPESTRIGKVRRMEKESGNSDFTIEVFIEST